MVLQYLTGKEHHYRCVKGDKDGASLSHWERNHYRHVEGVLGWCFNISEGKKLIIDAFRVYYDSASISHRVRKSL